MIKFTDKFLDKVRNYDYETLFKKKGYKYFTKGEYNLNIIGVRRNNNKRITNMFDDCLIVIYNNSKGTQRKLYNITTEPGDYYMRKTLGNPKGTAILVPNQYCGCWKLALHRGKYKALCQRKPVQVYRDGNYNNVYDLEPKTIDTGIFGINIHRANELWTRRTIDQYSAGCQVFNSPESFQSFIKLCEKQKELYGNSFTYTLLNEEDLK